MNPKVAIWGAGGHARVVADILRLGGQFGISGFIDAIDRQRSGREFCGSRVLGGVEVLAQLLAEGTTRTVIALGDCRARVETARIAQSAGFQLISAVHPKALLAGDAQIGEGTVICAGAVINPAAVIGANVIVNTSASVDHECVLEDGVHISPGARLAGRVHVGRATWIGIGAIVKDNVRIGANIVIGAGAVVLDDIPDGVIAYGVPARVIRKIDSRDSQEKAF